MAGWDFPTSMEIGERTWEIRSDFRAVLDVMEVLADDTISNEERAYVALSVFYIDYDPRMMTADENNEAISKLMWFVRGGRDEEKSAGPRLMDWDQDFHMLAPPINRVLGYECRTCEYLHWWTFLGAYMEIGDCYFANVVSIRSKRAQGKKLDKADQEFFRKHRSDIELRREITDADMDDINEWIM